MYLLTGMRLNCDQLLRLYSEKRFLLFMHVIVDLQKRSQQRLTLICQGTNICQKSQRFQSDLKKSKSLFRLCCLHFIAQNSYPVVFIYIQTNFRINILCKLYITQIWGLRNAIDLLNYHPEPSEISKQVLTLKNFKNGFSFIQVFVYLKTERA